MTVSYERPASGARITDRAGNAARAFSRTVENLVTDAPQAPALTASPRVDSALLLWTPPEHTGASPITGYEYRRAVHGTQESSAYGHWTAIAGSAALTSYWVGGLEGGTTYSFQLRAVNASGKGLLSEHADATPLVEIREQPPKGVRVVQGLDSSSLTVTWNAVPAPGLVTQHGKVEFADYTVWYRLRGTDEEEAQSVREGVQRGWSLRPAGASRTGSTSYTLTGLRPDTAYVVRVSAGFRTPGRKVWYKSTASVMARTGAGNGTALGTVEMLLTSRFDGMPRTHDGATAFEFRIAFSEAVAIEADAMRDHALAVAGGSVTAAAPVDGRGDLWSITVTPSGTETISILLAPGRACTESGAICTEDGRQLFSGAADELPAVVALPPVVILDADAVLAGFVLVDAASGADLGAVADGATVRVADPAGGSYDFRVETAADAAVGSVRLALAGPQDGDATARADDAAPYLLRGGTDGGAALPVGAYTLTATAYAGPGGTGAALGSLSVAFTVAPTVLTRFVLVDATAHADVGALADGARLTELDAAKVYGFRAEVAANGGVASVTLVLSGSVLDDDVTQTEGIAPWSLYGDSAGNEHGAALPVGSYTLTATAWSGKRGTGEALQTLRVSFAVGEAQVAPAEPLSAEFEDLPGTHIGSGGWFNLRVVFSEPVTIGEEAFAAHALIVGNGAVTEASRVEGAPGVWRAKITPASNAQVTVALAAGRACGEEGALCTADGRALERAPEASIAGPAVLTGFELVDLSAGGQRTTLESGATVRLADASGGNYGIVAKTASWETVGSVAFVLDQPGEDGDVTHTEGISPWSLHGDGGEDAITGAPLRVGSSTLSATAWSGPGGTGTVLDTLSVSFTVEAAQETAPPAATVLTATFVDMPAEHGGEGVTFTFEVHFDPEPRVSYKVLRDESFAVTGGTVEKARRVKGRNDQREIHVKPTGMGDITVRLAGGRACGTTGAICTADGEVLSNSLSATVAGLPALSVADATVEEGPNATLDFRVTLDRAASGPVTVTYATADQSATAGQDYEATTGTLTFNPGETATTVSVVVLDDAHDDDQETLKVVLSDASGATLADGEAIGTIRNDDPLQRAWLARFGRTVATHVTDAVEERFRAAPGLESHLTVGGYRLPLEKNTAGAAEPGTNRLASPVTELVGMALGLGGGQPGFGGMGPDPWADPRLGQSRTLTLNLRQILQGSSFRLTVGRDAAGTRPRLTAWGRFAGTTFDGRDGDLSLDGDVFTGTVGVDGAWERWLAGVAVAHSRGDGAFTMPGTEERGRGDLENTLTSLHPYLRYAVNDRLAVWGVLGYGWGHLDLEMDTGETLETDTDLVMGAVGGRGILLAAANSGGFEVATRTDAMFTRTTSDAVAGMEGADADAHRVRLILEGSRGVAWAEGRTLTPSVELGLRHDWGDAETGFGLELGGRVQYADPGLGLTIEGAVRALLAHEDADYEEWGAWGTVRVAPGAAGQGLALTVAPAWGAASSGVDGLWSRQTTAGLAPPGQRRQPAGRLTAEVGYGFTAFDTGLLTPYAGTVLADGESRTYRVGGRLRLNGGWATGLALTLEGQRQESAGQQPDEPGPPTPGHLGLLNSPSPCPLPISRFMREIGRGSEENVLSLDGRG